jgi:hypothetical protein
MLRYGTPVVGGLVQEHGQRRRAIRATPAQRGVGELPQHSAACGTETTGLGVNLAQEILRHGHHHLGHRASIPGYTPTIEPGIEMRCEEQEAFA